VKNSISGSFEKGLTRQSSWDDLVHRKCEQNTGHPRNSKCRKMVCQHQTKEERRETIRERRKTATKVNSPTILIRTETICVGGALDPGGV